MKTKTAGELAVELEGQLEEYPDERGQILVEAAEAWRQAGDHDRAIALLNQAVALGGEVGGNARVDLAQVLFDLDQTDQAHAQLDELRRERPSSPAPYQLAAELFEGRDEPQQALTWYNMAVSRLAEKELTNRDPEFGAFSFANSILAGRRRVRQALGIPADELDESVLDPSEQIKNLARALAPAARREARVLFWPRLEFARAHQTWPQLVGSADPGTFFAEREAANHELSEAGVVARIVMVPLTVERLQEFTARTGRDAIDDDARMACMNEIAEEGGGISWPPARNAPCWCGSSAKYKKCCGGPRLD